MAGSLLIWSPISNLFNRKWGGGQQVCERKISPWGKFSFCFSFINLDYTWGQNWVWTSKALRQEKKHPLGGKNGDRCAPDFVYTVVHQPPVLQSPAQVYLCHETFPDTLSLRWSWSIALTTDNVHLALNTYYLKLPLGYVGFEVTLKCSSKVFQYKIEICHSKKSPV